MSFSNARGGYDRVFVLVAGRRRIAKSEVRKLAPIWLPMLLALREAADAPSHQCHNRIWFGSSRPSERRTTSAPQDSCGHPGDIFCARHPHRPGSRWHADFEAGVGPK
jgi:hypothetical protein